MIQGRPIRALLTGFLLAATLAPGTGAQEAKSSRGRKYKAPPETSHIEVQVLRDYNGKPILNAAVIFHPVLNGRDEGNLEVKTNDEGRAIIDVIPTGSDVEVQVIADGFATFAESYLVKESNRAIAIRMLRPRAQISTYTDAYGQAADRPSGVQEPAHPATAPTTQTLKPTNHTSDPNPIAPVSPNATPPSDQSNTPR